MDQRKPRILMIGALPPPAIGPFVAMQRLVESPVLNDAFTVDFLDISDRRAPSNIGRFDWMNLLLGLKHAFQCFSRLLLHPPNLVYLGISQGIWGYLRDLTFVIPAICLRRRVVLHLRGSEFRIFYQEMPGWLKWLTRWVLSRTVRVIVLGNGLRQIFAALVSPDRVVAIPNGIDCQAFAPPPAAAARPPGKRILYLSSLMKRKGLFLLLEALPAVFAGRAAPWRAAVCAARPKRFDSCLTRARVATQARWCRSFGW
jgi:glycosyltransferase involved in cell wall biosynthesis